MHGFIDNEEKVTYSIKSRIQDKSAKATPYLKPKWPRSIPYL